MNLGQPKNNRRLKPFFVRMLVVLLLLLVLFAASFLGYKVLKVNRFIIEGNSITSDRDITSASGVTFGTSMFDLNYEKIKQNISMLPRIEVLSIDYTIPSTLNIVVRERTVDAVIRFLDECIFIDRKGNVLSIERKANMEGVILVKGITVTAYAAGNILSVTDEYQLSVLESVIDALEHLNMKNHYTVIDLTNAIDVRLLAASGVTVRLGQAKSLEDKLQKAAAVLDKLEQDQLEGGVVDCSSVSAVTYTKADPNPPSDDTSAQQTDVQKDELNAVDNTLNTQE